MSKRHIFILFIFVLVIGAAFEALQNIRVDNSQKGQINGLLSSLDLKPFVRTLKGESTASRQKIKHKAKSRRVFNDSFRSLQQLAVNQKTKADGQLDLGDSSNAKAPDSEKKAKSKKDENTDNEDEIKCEDGDEECEAKKKELQAQKDKENDEDSEEDDSDIAELLEENNNDVDKAPESDSTNSNPNDVVAGGTPISPQDEDDEEAVPVNELIAEWEDKLLRQPDYKVLNEFITKKQSGKLSNEVFYTVVNTLLSDSREPIQVMGVYALGATPSAQSFERIVEVSATAPFGSAISQAAQKYKQTYATLNQLKILETVLYSSENIESVKVAIQLVDQAVTTYLSSNPDEEPPVNPDDVAALNNARRLRNSMFTGFTDILASLSQSDVDASLASAATQTLNRITEAIPEAGNSLEDENLVSNF